LVRISSQPVLRQLAGGHGTVAGNDGSSVAVNGGQLTIGGDITNGYNDTLTISSGTAAITGNIITGVGDSSKANPLMGWQVHLTPSMPDLAY